MRCTFVNDGVYLLWWRRFYPLVDRICVMGSSVRRRILHKEEKQGLLKIQPAVMNAH